MSQCRICQNEVPEGCPYCSRECYEKGTKPVGSRECRQCRMPLPDGAEYFCNPLCQEQYWEEPKGQTSFSGTKRVKTIEEIRAGLERMRQSPITEKIVLKNGSTVYLDPRERHECPQCHCKRYEAHTDKRGYKVMVDLFEGNQYDIHFATCGKKTHVELLEEYL